MPYTIGLVYLDFYHKDVGYVETVEQAKQV